MAGRRDKSFHGVKVQIDGLIHLRVPIRIHQNGLDLTALEPPPLDKILDHRFSWFHDRGQGIAFHSHVGKHRLLLKREVLQSRSSEFHDFARKYSSGFGFMGEMQNHILRGTRWPQVSGEANAYCLRHAAGNFIVFPHTRNFRVADAVCQTIQRTGRAGVRVGSNDDLAGQSDFFADHGVAYAGTPAVCGCVIVNAGFLGNAFLALTKVSDSGKRFRRDSRKISR